jgi:hypothetical protein
MCVFSLISLYSQTPGSTLLPVSQKKINEIEKIDRQTDEHHTKEKEQTKRKIARIKREMIK